MTVEFSNVHRFFVQFMLNNGCVTKNNALRFFEEISPELHSMAALKSIIIEINRKISEHCFNIAETICEITGEEVLVWLNVKNDEISKLQIGFSVIELEYFHTIMQEIITSDDHKIPYPRAVNISSTLTGTFSKENGEKTLMKWFKSGYYVKQDKYIYLGPRTILEFTTYLKTNTENCSCDLCSDLVFRGGICNSCHKIFHKYCLEKYLQSGNVCPNCKSVWEQADSSMEIDLNAGDSN